MYSLRDYNDKRKLGVYFGYPECCIDFFMNKSTQLRKQETINGKASNGSGFIPCTKHAQQILNKEIRLVDILHNRECEAIFPKDNGIVIQRLRIKLRYSFVMNELRQNYSHNKTQPY